MTDTQEPVVGARMRWLLSRYSENDEETVTFAMSDIAAECREQDAVVQALANVLFRLGASFQGVWHITDCPFWKTGTECDDELCGTAAEALKKAGR